MLEYVDIRNFQIHKSLEVELDPRITVLVGDNDVGKSSFVRALRWLTLNDLRGDSCISWTAKECFLGLVIDGQWLCRRRGPGINYYRLDGKIINVPGTSVPDPVARLLNVGPGNFQGQLDPLFWFSLTAGQIGRELNRIVNLDSIDRSMAYIATRLRQTSAAVEVGQKRLQEAEESLKSLEWLPELNKRLVDLEYTEDQLAQNRIKRRRLSDLVEALSRYDSEADLKRKALFCRDLLARLEKLRAKTDKTVQRQRVLEDLIDGIEVGEERICHMKNELAETEHEMQHQRRGRCPICGARFSP